MDLFDRIVTETVHSGNAPLKLTYVGIYDGQIGKAIAYRTRTEVFCSSYGVLEPGYTRKTDTTDVGSLLTVRNAIHGMREIKTLFAADKKPAWVSVEASTSFLLMPELYECLVALMKNEEFSMPETLCFEFSRSIFDADREKIRKGLTDLKTIGCKTLLGNFATDGFPITTLLDVPVDYAVLTPEVTALALDRNKEDVLPALVRFLRSMNVETIPAGVKSDAEIKEINKMDCFGILPAEEYAGRFTFALREKGKFSCEEVIEMEESI